MTSIPLAAIIEDLLSPASLTDAQNYHNDLLNKYSPGVEVRYNLENGKGLFATKSFDIGEVILRDPPLASSQHFQNRKHCLNCASCLKFVGSIERQIASHLRPDLFPDCPQAKSGVISTILRDRGLDQSGYESDEYSEEDVEFDDGLMQEDWKSHHCLLCTGPGPTTLQNKNSSKINSEDEAGCSSSIYCSSNFQNDFSSLRVDGSAGASSSAPSSSPPYFLPNEFSPRRNQQALINFYEHACCTNDIFLLAAKVVAKTMLRAYDLLLSSPSLSPPQALSKSFLPVKSSHRKIWWEAVSDSERLRSEFKSDSEEDQAGPSTSSSKKSDSKSGSNLCSEIKALATESARLLKLALLDNGETESEKEEGRIRELFGIFEALFDPRVYSSIVGMFELNNLSFEIENPVEDYFLFIDDLKDKKEKKQVMAVTQPLLDALGRRYCIYAEGTAFYPIQSCCNHSCSPNTEALRRPEDKDVRATLYARENINPGDEILISYIDLENEEEDKRGNIRRKPRGLEERREDLLDYGFVCRCARCQKEEAQ